MSAIQGLCDLCGQELLLTHDDCWHPYAVPVACPPEPASGTTDWLAWYQAGNRPGRPGREHWMYAPQSLAAAEQHATGTPTTPSTDNEPQRAEEGTE